MATARSPARAPQPVVRATGPIVLIGRVSGHGSARVGDRSWPPRRRGPATSASTQRWRCRGARPPALNKRADSTVSLEELEYTRAVVAYATTLHGAVYAPILDRIEREIEAVRKADPVARAHAILEAHTALMNKVLDARNLRLNGETRYSLRHTFKDRLRAAGATDELKDALMGHRRDQPAYGFGMPSASMPVVSSTRDRLSTSWNSFGTRRIRYQNPLRLCAYAALTRLLIAGFESAFC